MAVIHGQVRGHFILSGLSTITADIDQSDNIHIAWKSGSWVTTNTINTLTQNAGDTMQFMIILTTMFGVHGKTK